MNPVATVKLKYNNDGAGYLFTEVKFPLMNIERITTESVKKYVFGMLAFNGYRNIDEVVIDVEEFENADT